MGSLHRVLGILCAALLTGCATYENVAGKKIPYGGFLDDISYRRQPEDVIGIGPVIVAIDTPLTLIGDTATLPITLCAATSRYVQARRKDAEERERSRPVTTVPAQQEPALAERLQSEKR